jgi:outer membrane protein assembly factor BamE (lipoprotein component of BamABCDE complex)
LDIILHLHVLDKKCIRLILGSPIIVEKFGSNCIWL